MMEFFCLIAILALTNCQNDDLVDQESIQKLGLNYTETVYSGYLPVNVDGSAQFHYFYLHSDDRKPITLWLNGGPGCSSAQGLFNENGPTKFIFGTTILESNPYSWTTVSNMLYVESPIGVGFSYGPKPTQEQTDKTTAKYNLQALISFFKKFPLYQTSEFYISGESYAGIYIPTLASEIIDYNNSPKKEFTINLKGILVGNGCTDSTECTITAEGYPQHRFDFLGRHNLISRQTHKAAMENVNNCYGQESDQCDAIIMAGYSEFQKNSFINPYNVYGICPIEDFIVNGMKIERSKKLKRDFFKYSSSIIDPCDDSIGIYTILRNPDFLKAFHINTEKTPSWFECSDINYYREEAASYYVYPKLIQNKIRIWKFSGDIDAVVPITGTLYWINKFQNQYNLRTLVEWRPWYITGKDDGRRQNAGNYWKLNGITFISVKDAGHMVPTDKGQAALTMFIGFLQDTDLPEF